MNVRATGICCVALAIVAPACSGDDDASASTAATTTVTPATGTASDDSTAASTSPPTSLSTAPSTAAATTTAPPAPTTSIAPPPSTDAPDTEDWTTILTDLRLAEFALPRNPSLDGIDDVCATVSECRESTTATIQFLVDNDLHVEGGAPFEIRSVEFEGTTDDVPLAEALGVVLIVRETVVDQGVVNLVDADGNVVEPVAPDPSRQPGDEISRAVVLGRDTIDGEWRLSVIGEAE